ncbi:uncharacterized protein LOC144559223 [Carex rostrata]
MSFSLYNGHEDSNFKEKENYLNLRLDWSEESQQYHEETDSLLKLPPYLSENNSNTNRTKSTTKKKSWIKYFSFLSKFTKQSKTSLQKKQVSYSFTWKSKRCPKLGPATGVACKLASIHEAIRRTASGPLVRCFNPAKDEEIEVPYIQLEKLGYYALRREAFGPIYMVT